MRDCLGKYLCCCCDSDDDEAPQAKPKKKIFYLYAIETHKEGLLLNNYQLSQRREFVKNQKQIIQNYASMQGFDVELHSLDLSEPSILNPEGFRSLLTPLPREELINPRSQQASPDSLSRSASLRRSPSQTASLRSSASPNSPRESRYHTPFRFSQGSFSLNDLYEPFLEASVSSHEMTDLLNPRLNARNRSSNQYSPSDTDLMNFRAHIEKLIAEGKMTPEFDQSIRAINSEDEIIFQPFVTANCISSEIGIYLDPSRNSRCITTSGLARFIYYLAPQHWEILAQTGRQIKLIYMGDSGQSYNALTPSFEIYLNEALQKYTAGKVLKPQRRHGYHLSTVPSMPPITQPSVLNLTRLQDL